MSTQETALFNVNIILSTVDGFSGELPSDEKVAEIIGYRMNRGIDTLPKFDCLGVNVVYRTGDLDNGV